MGCSALLDNVFVSICEHTRISHVRIRRLPEPVAISTSMLLVLAVLALCREIF